MISLRNAWSFPPSMSTSLPAVGNDHSLKLPRRDVILAAAAVFAVGVTGTSAIDDPLVLIDGWVVRQSDLRGPSDFLD